MNEVIAISFKNILNELKVGKFTEKDLKFIIEMSKGIIEASVIVMRRNMVGEKKDIPAGE
jgi:hypothetical protein